MHRFRLATNVRPLREVLSLLCLCCAAVGCGSGEKRIKTTPVSGTVTFEGKPVPEGSLLFVPVVAGPSGQANLREDGTFVAGTYEKADGLIPGEYDVMIQGNIIPTDPNAVPLMPHEVAQRPPAKKHALPDRYGDQKKSGLKTAIQMGQQTPLKFDLQK